MRVSNMDYDLSTAVKTVAGFGVALGVSALATDVEAAVVPMTVSGAGTVAFASGTSFVFNLSATSFAGAVSAIAWTNGVNSVGPNFPFDGHVQINQGDTVSAGLPFVYGFVPVTGTGSVATFGFRTDTNNFGWFQIQFGTTPTILTAFYETVAGAPITAAVVPLPASATMLGGALALAGGAAALRRRRKAKAEAVAA